MRPFILAFFGVAAVGAPAAAYSPGSGNTGYSNTGYSNTGYSNTGYSNTGYSNTGYSNTGYSNTGYSNTAYAAGGGDAVFFDTGFLNGGIISSTKQRAAGQVAQGAWAHVAEVPVTAGNTLTVTMTGSGDPDLYVKFGAQPNANTWDCRPYIGGANESCTVTVPSGATLAYVSVVGFTAGAFDLSIRGYDVRLDGMRTNQDQRIDNVSLNGTQLAGSAYVLDTVPITECEEPYGCWTTGYQQEWRYRPLGWSEFVGAAIQVNVVDAGNRSTYFGDMTTRGVIAARITSIQQGTGEDYDMFTYGLDVFENNAWRPYCEDGARAIPLQGGWNYRHEWVTGGAKATNSANRVTWACLNSSYGKCAAGKTLPMGLGYKTWTSHNSYYKEEYMTCSSYNVCRPQTNWVVVNSTGVGHQACSRMIVADYCGDGTPHTVKGRGLDVWDMFPTKINNKDYRVNLPPGASWNDAGANHFTCTGRVDQEWQNDCRYSQKGYYCEGVCPVYFRADGTKTSHQFDYNDNGGQSCPARESFSTQQEDPGVVFGRNEIVNTNETS